MGVWARTIIRVKGGMITRSFDRATADPRAAQTRLLLNILHANAQTEYGKAHAFSRIADANAFASAVPINTFAALSPYVEQMKDGRANILTAEAPVMFNRTSGTTDVPKCLPVTPTALAATAAASCQWLCRALKDHPSLLDHAFLCVSGSPAQSNSPKNARRSSTSNSGCSAAAKCPPAGITVQRCTFAWRSATFLGTIRTS